MGRLFGASQQWGSWRNKRKEGGDRSGEVMKGSRDGLWKALDAFQTGMIERAMGKSVHQGVAGEAESSEADHREMEVA
jgi:hypothetical protein